MNNTINGMKNTPEEINSRITEAEEWISELKTECWKSLPRNRTKKKEWKEMREVSETSRTILNHSHYRDPRRRIERERAWEIFEEIIAISFPNMGNKRVTQVQEGQSPIQHKCKEEHTETHINQTDKN